MFATSSHCHLSVGWSVFEFDVLHHQADIECQFFNSRGDLCIRGHSKNKMSSINFVFFAKFIFHAIIFVLQK